MAKVYTLIEFTDAEGTHEVGSEVELPRTTDAEKAEFEQYLQRGIVSTTKPAAPEKDGEETQRTPRGRR